MIETMVYGILFFILGYKKIEGFYFGGFLWLLVLEEVIWEYLGSL